MTTATNFFVSLLDFVSVTGLEVKHDYFVGTLVTDGGNTTFYGNKKIFSSADDVERFVTMNAVSRIFDGRGKDTTVTHFLKLVKDSDIVFDEEKRMDIVERLR